MEGNDEGKSQRGSQVRMALRLVQYASLELQRTPAPKLTLDKHFLLREGKLKVDVSLDRKWHQYDQPIGVSIRVHNGSSRNVRKIRVNRFVLRLILLSIL